MNIRSEIVVNSWWSNTLALECLERLFVFTHGRTSRVVQVGKAASSRVQFRRCLPTGAVELDCADDAPEEHSRVIYDVAVTVALAESHYQYRPDSVRGA